MGHDDAVTARRQVVDFFHRLFADDLVHARGHLFRKLLFPGVDPAHPTGQAGQQRHQGAADMSGAEHGDLRLHLAHGLEQQHRGAAAALAEAGAEAEALQVGALLAAGEHVPGELHGLVFQVAAADGVEGPGGADDHFRAGIARRRTELFDDGHQHAGLSLVLQVGEGADPVVHVHLDILVVCPGLSLAITAAPARLAAARCWLPAGGASARSPTTPVPESLAHRSAAGDGSRRGWPPRP